MSERRTLTKHDLRLSLQRAGLKNLLETSQPFRQFVWTIFTEARIFAPTYSRGSPHETSYQEGRRALGLEVLHILKSSRPDILALIEGEGNLTADELEGPNAAQSPEDDPE